jgi:hypothetical protein
MHGCTTAAGRPGARAGARPLSGSSRQWESRRNDRPENKGCRRDGKVGRRRGRKQSSRSRHRQRRWSRPPLWIEHASPDGWRRIVTWPPDNCFHCKRPIVFGAKWVELVNDNDRARFHSDCAPAWRAQQEGAARKAMGLPVIERSSTKEPPSP